MFEATSMVNVRFPYLSQFTKYSQRNVHELDLYNGPRSAVNMPIEMTLDGNSNVQSRT